VLSWLAVLATALFINHSRAGLRLSFAGERPDALDAAGIPVNRIRCLAILASEDIGNADPRALPLAAACYEVVERIGMPEARITLAQTACFLALCPKSNASYLAIDAALKDVREGRTVEVPVYLRDTNSSPMGEGERAKGYVYSHGEKDAVGTQDYLGVDKVYYQPTDRGEEKQLAERMREFETRRRDSRTQ
jgi:putative ATPase